MKKNKNIFLIGPLGVGKTTIGKRIARRAHLIFYDSDQEIEKITGVSITTIFEIEGEAGFRKREKEMIEKLTLLDSIVLSSGGGAVLSPENLAAFSERGTVVYLRASLETQFKRTSQRKGTRPLLNNADPYETIVALSKVRYPLYESIADFSYDTDQATPEDIADDIVQMVLCGS